MTMSRYQIDRWSQSSKHRPEDYTPRNNLQIKYLFSYKLITPPALIDSGQ